MGVHNEHLVSLPDAPWGGRHFSPLELYYVHGRWYNPETALWLSPNEKGDYLYGGDGPGVQDTVNRVWRLIQAVNPNEMITGGIYQWGKNNADATASWGSLLVGPVVHNAYDQFFTGIEEGFPDTPSFRFGRVVGSAVTIKQGIDEATTGFTMATGGELVLCPTLGAPSGGTSCVAPVAVGSALVGHGVNVGVVGTWNTVQQGISFMKGRGKPSGSWRPSGPNWTQNAKLVKQRLGLTDTQFNEAIHSIKRQVSGNPDM